MSDWLTGPPPKKGTFWFQPCPNDRVVSTLLYRHGHVYGRGGSMPLSMVYIEKLCPYARRMPIIRTSEWREFEAKDLSGEYACWIKVGENIGVALGKGSQAMIVWTKHPNSAMIAGEIIVIGKHKYAELEVPT